VAAVVGLMLYGVISVSLLVHPIDVPGPTTVPTPEESRTSVQIGKAFMNVREATPKANITGMTSGPERTRMGYLLPFEIVSVHLLVVLIAAAYLARAKRRRGAVS
jgi:hypothetical protein